jgi:hypothetical protein
MARKWRVVFLAGGPTEKEQHWAAWGEYVQRKYAPPEEEDETGGGGGGSSVGGGGEASSVARDKGKQPMTEAGLQGFSRTHPRRDSSDDD